MLDNVADVTRLIVTAAEGNQHAAAELLPLIYDEFRKLAAVRLAQEKPGQTLHAIALVHEAYLRLLGKDRKWNGRGHFFAAAAEAMRRIFVNRARDKGRLKRGGDRQRVDFKKLTDAGSAHADDLLDLDEALNRLAATHPDCSQLVKLRFFAVLTLPKRPRHSVWPAEQRTIDGRSPAPGYSRPSCQTEGAK